MAVPLQILAFLGALSLVTASSQDYDKAPIVDLGYTRYVGHYNDTAGLNEFYGIRFAEPLTPAQRWKAAVPVSNSTFSSQALQNASSIASVPTCVQGYPAWMGENATIPDGTEDCLVLHVYQPSNATSSSKLPVMVMIHGGGYTLGWANLVDPHALLRHSSNAFVYVSVQYRLGAYGFLGSKKYTSEGGVVNLGLQDQRLSLEWVQKYIHQFGGDPEKVTINGGSAGGGSVTSQLIWKGGEQDPPFRSAIAEFPWWQQLLKEEQLERQYETLLRAANVTSLAELRALPAEKLAIATQVTYSSAYKDESYGYGHFYYGPYVDGSLIQDLPSREFRNGHFAKVPVLVDRDMYEGVSFTNASLATINEETADVKIQFPYGDATFVKELYEHYPASDFNSTFFQRVQWFGRHNVPVYKLIFNAGKQTHSATTSFEVDPSPLYPLTGYNATIADFLQGWLVSFTLHGEPNADNSGSPSWPVYNDEGANIMIVNYTSIGVVSDRWFDTSARCEWLWENGDVIQN